MFKLLTALVVLTASTSAFASFSFQCSNDEGWGADGMYDNVMHGRASLSRLYLPDGTRPLQYGLASQRVDTASGTMTLKVNVYKHGQIVLYCDLPR